MINDADANLLTNKNSALRMEIGLWGPNERRKLKKESWN